MRRPRRRIPGAVAIWLALGLGAARADEPLDVRVATLLAEAQRAASTDQAEAKLRQAEKLFGQEGRRLERVARGFLHADILRVRGRVAVLAWKRKATDAAAREQARKLLLEAIGEYAGLVKLCEDRLDAIERRYTNRDPSEDKNWRRFSGYISRANYAEAWSHYNLGLVAREPAERKRRLRQAIERFSSFTAGGYRAHAVVADCFLGQALCHYELKQHFQVLELLKPARPDNTPPASFKRMTYVRIKAAQAYGSHLAAENAAKQYFDSSKPDRRLDAIELEMALERIRCLSVLADPRQNPEYHRLFRGRLDAVARRVYSHGEPWRGELAKLLGRGNGASVVQHLSKARTLLEAKRFAAAAAEADQGLRAAQPRTDAALLADLRYVRAAATASEGKHLQAHRYAVEFLRRHPTDDRAAGLCAAVVQTGRAALKADPPLPPAELAESLALLEESFPGQPVTEKLPWYRAELLLETGRFADAERALGRVRPADAVYVLAQYGLALAAAKQAEALAREAPGDPNALLGALDRSAGAVGRFAGAAAGKRLSGEQRQAAAGVVDVGVAVARRYLALPTPRPAAALSLLDHLDKLPSQRARAATRRLAARVRAEVQAGGIDSAGRHIDELLDSAGTTGQDLAATLADVAPALSAEFDALSEAGKAEAAAAVGRQVLRIQRLLLRHVRGSADKQVRAQEAAARRGLADILRKLGRHKDAIEHYRWLVAHTPRRRAGGALRGLALCHERTGQFGPAAEKWRTLAKGLEKRTEGYYEARYHWIRCVSKAGRREQARKVLAYFRLQHPRIAIRPWQDRFDALARELGLDGRTPAGQETK